ncbi:hypothetical protein PV646_02950 [Streptomyces sp. ID05-26A]|nr:hypothetical protein [Streptomyces sp. ID05-26A]
MQVDEYGRAEEHRLLWKGPATVGQLGELMAQWLDGTITYQPGYGAPGPDPETSELVEVLAAVNRAGVLTTFSQPGEPLVDGHAQRASLDGFCTEHTADLLRRATLHTDLVTLIFPPGSQEGGQVVVTVDDGQEFTWLGSPADLGHLYDIYGDDLSEAAIEALGDAWQLHIVDPVWGRNDLLWDQLRRFTGAAG